MHAQTPHPFRTQPVSVPGILALFGAAVLVCLTLMITGPLAQASPTGSTLQMYSANYGNPGTVSPFSLTTNSFGTPITVGADPTDAILSPDGSTLYVLNYNGDSISVIDTATGQVTQTFDLASEGLYAPYPYMGTITPDGNTLYIVDGDYDTYAINAKTGALEATYGTGGEVYPYDLAISPSGNHVFVVQYEGGAESEGALETIDTQTGATSTVTLSSLTPPAGSLPMTYDYAVTVSPDGANLYFIGYPYNASTNTYDSGIAVFNRASGQITQEFNFGSDSSYRLGLAVVSSNGQWLYVTDDESSTSTGGVYLINLATGTMQRVVMDDPYALAVSPDGTRLYVDEYGQSTLEVVDVNSTSTTFGQVLDSVSSAPSDEYADIMGVPPVHADPTAITIEQPADPVPGTVTSDVVNNTSCPLTYSVSQEPSSGDLSFNDGSFTFTPTLGDLPASNSFAWTATPPANCTADFAPNEVVPAQGTVTFVWKPTFGGISPVMLSTGQSSGTVSFNLFTSAPVALTATSSDPSVVPPGAIDLSQDCAESCTFTLTAGQAGTSTVDLLATEPSGVTASTAFSVTVTSPSTSSGSGGFGPWALFALLGLCLARRRALRRHA